MAILLSVFVVHGAGVRRATYLCLDCTKDVDKNWNINLIYYQCNFGHAWTEHYPVTFISDFGPKITFHYYVMFLHQKYSLMHQDYSHTSVSLSYMEIFKIKAIKVLIYSTENCHRINGTIMN